MSKIIIIRGPLGVGKSTISKKLAEELDAEYLSVDEVLSENGLDKIDFEIGCIPEKNFIKVNEIIYPTILKNINKNKPIIIDGNFYHKKVLENFLSNFNKQEIIVFTLKASKNTCVKRDAQRKNPHGATATIAVYDLVSKFDYGKIILNEDHKIEEKVKNMIAEIK